MNEIDDWILCTELFPASVYNSGLGGLPNVSVCGKCLCQDKRGREQKLVVRVHQVIDIDVVGW